MEERSDNEHDTSIPGLVFHSLHRAHRNAVQMMMTQEGMQDLGAPMILFTLRQRGLRGEFAAQRELADEIHVSPSTVATSLKSLERLGYVEKSSDPTDARRKRISITSKGAEAVDKCREIFDQVDGWMMEGLTAKEEQELIRIHLRMLSNLREKTDGKREMR
ncbi:MAG: Transcriptional regulator, MarRNA family [Oscillospiraceae bacterium]|nr:Transcriptional regulator, MarRNA family [Oscillospiraceae bacterium]